MNSSATRAHERLLSNSEFWDMFLPLFYNEKEVSEFSKITGLSEQRIKAARDEHFDRYVAKNVAPHFHRNNGTVN
jgi:hypothetical protein